MIMLFQRYPTYEAYTFTDRKRNAYLRKLKKEQNKYPLFAEEIAAQQLSVEEEEQRRIRIADKTEMGWRQLHAKQWRDVRVNYYSLCPIAKAEVKSRWIAWTGPRNPTCLCYLIRSYGLPLQDLHNE